MSRFSILIIIAGIALGVWGYEEYKVGRGTGSEPVAMELAEIEKTGKVKSNYINIGPHLQVFPGCVYTYTQEKGGAGPTENTTINYLYFPIISEEHPYLQSLFEMAESYGGWDKVPENAPWPTLSDFTVLVKSVKYHRVGDIPAELKEKQGIVGLVISEIEELEDDEKRLLRESFPKVNFDKVLILEENRTPMTGVMALGILAGGVVLVLVGVGLLILPLGRRAGKAIEEEGPDRKKEDEKNDLGIPPPIE